MGTHSVIAVPLDNGFRGRYAHWDGYPIAMGRVLWTIVHRDGVEKARAVLTEDHSAWSVINATGDGDKDNVPGYGQADTDQPDDAWWTDDDIDSCMPYAYILNDHAISVLAPATDEATWVHLGDLPYDREPTEAELIAMQCGANFERCTHYARYHVPALDQNDRRGMAEYLAATRTLTAPIWHPGGNQGKAE